MEQSTAISQGSNIKVVVAGGWDPLHVGHISHIREARKLGDWLIVIVNSDQDMVRKKGFCFMPQGERMEIMASLKWVDEVVPSIDRDGSVAQTLSRLRPQVFAKGGDRRPGMFPIPNSELEACREIGCTIIYEVGDEKIQSSSGLVEAIRSK